jgi:hypothetical protein
VCAFKTLFYFDFFAVVFVFTGAFFTAAAFFTGVGFALAGVFFIACFVPDFLTEVVFTAVLTTVFFACAAVFKGTFFATGFEGVDASVT